jgi:hypothetical protein
VRSAGFDGQVPKGGGGIQPPLSMNTHPVARAAANLSAIATCVAGRANATSSTDGSASHGDGIPL